MKPKIIKGWWDCWWCYTDGYMGEGRSVMAAYNNWYAKVLRDKL